ncbi:MAG: hypothetical protein MRZ79_16395 [Bacteroidia bacterium]|nr:hypothetical protein [Bacteroidia bacterium]
MMDWKELQTQWQQSGEGETHDLPIPTEKKLESIENGLKYFYQEQGKNPNTYYAIVQFGLSALMIPLLIKKGFSEIHLGHLVFIILPLAIGNLIKAIQFKETNKEESLLVYLKSSLKEVRWIIFQQVFLFGSMAVALPIYLIAQSNSSSSETWDGKYLLLLIPFMLIFAVLIWWYRNHHNYNVYRLNGLLSGLIEELES